MVVGESEYPELVNECNHKIARTEVASDKSFIKVYCKCGKMGYVYQEHIDWEEEDE